MKIIFKKIENFRQKALVLRRRNIDGYFLDLSFLFLLQVRVRLSTQQQFCRHPEAMFGFENQ
jgi:hypothetical protein